MSPPAPALLARALALAAQHLDASIEVTDPEVRLQWVNPAFEALHGRPAAQVLGRTPAELGLAGPGMRVGHAHLEARLVQDDAAQALSKVVRPGGTAIPVELQLHAVRDDAGALLGHVAIKMAQLDSLAADRTRNRRRHDLHILLDRAPLPAVVHCDNVVRYANPAMGALMGEPPADLLGDDVQGWLVPEDLDHFEARKAQAMTAPDTLGPTRYRLRRRDGGVIPVRVVPVGFLEYDGEPAYCVMLQDIRAEQDEQQRLILADRLRTVGQVAAGVAHEVNNPLTYVLDSLERALSSLPAEHPAREALGAAVDGTHRIGSIVRDLALFTREPGQDPHAVSLGEVVRAAADMARRPSEGRARIVVAAPELPVWVQGTSPRLGQVLLNLVLNAVQASPEHGRGEVRIAWGVDGSTAWLTVADQGRGMPREVQARAFDPFYTTRAGAGGTGLGLAICRDILHGLGGTIALDSAPGAGTTVHVTLPRAAPPRDGGRTAPACACRILVVDDDPLVARAVSRTVGRAGCVAEVVTDGPAALERLTRSPVPDVILCDLMMPGMDGPALTAALASRHPDLADRLIYMTGGAFTEAAHAFLDRTGAPCLVKPFSPQDLSAALGELDTAGA
jgi:PAS domain S-box-containing protein